MVKAQASETQVLKLESVNFVDVKSRQTVLNIEHRKRIANDEVPYFEILRFFVRHSKFVFKYGRII